MGWSKQGNNLIIWGRATKDASLFETKNGRFVSNFPVKYSYRHDEDGNVLVDYMNVDVWGKLAKIVGDDTIGVAKGDMVLVAGQILRDNFYGKDEDKTVPKYKLNAELVFDMTSINQLMEMVMATEEEEPAEEEPPKPKPKIINAATQPEFEDNNEYDKFSGGDPVSFENWEEEPGQLPF